MKKRWTIDEIKKFVENNSDSKLLTTEYHGFLKSYYLNVHVVVTLKKHLRSLTTKTNVNVKSAKPPKEAR